MTIPVNTVVNVAISTTPQFPSRAGFGVLNILGTTDVIPAAERIRFYSSIAGVEADFSDGDPELAMATSYFSQEPKPTQLAISRQFLTDQAGQALGGGNAEALIATWNLISDGTFNITIDGAAAEDITALDFSTDTTLPLVAATIQTGLQAIATGGFTAATCEYNNGRFIITSGTTGATSTVSAASAVGTGTDITSLIDMAAGVATLQTGFVAEADPVDAIAPIVDKSNAWYGFALDNGHTPAQVQAVAADIEARVKVFCHSSQDATILDAATTTDIASLLSTSDYRRTFSFYHPDPTMYPHVSAFARAFTVDFGGTDTTITLKFKQLPGVSSTDLTTTQKLATEGKDCNVYTTVGTVAILAEGVMANGIFFDEVHGVDWLTDAIENNVFGYMFTRPTKVPLTDKGGASLEQQVIRALDEGVQNGLLAPGTDIAGNFLANGYSTSVQKVADMNQADVDNRVAPTITFKALLAGAVHTVEINGTLER